MKVFLAACLLVLAMQTTAPAAEVDRSKPLSYYEGKNRVLLVFSPEPKNPDYLAQLKICQDETAGFAERDLLVIKVPVLEGGPPPTGDGHGALAKRFKVDETKFQVVLVGKDGHDAFRSGKPVAAAKLYEIIDAMPMRREEMKRQKKE